jgi:hypothetical protein
MIVAEKPRRLLLGIDGRHRLLRLAALHVQPIGVGGPQTPAFDLVAARERLHLPPLAPSVALTRDAEPPHRSRQPLPPLRQRRL